MLLKSGRFQGFREGNSERHHWIFGCAQFMLRKSGGHKKTAAAFQPPQFVKTLIFPCRKIERVSRLEDDLQGKLNLPRSPGLCDLCSCSERIVHRGAVGSLDEPTASDVHESRLGRCARGGSAAQIFRRLHRVGRAGHKRYGAACCGSSRERSSGWSQEVHVVENVEEFRTEFKGALLSQDSELGILGNGEVPVDDSRKPQVVTGRITLHPQGGLTEHQRVEPV